MPNFNEMGPASSPRLYLENNLEQVRQHYAGLDQQLRDQFESQEIDQDTASSEILRLQREFGEESGAINAKLSTIQQAQGLMDSGFLDDEAGMKAMWTTALPEETVKAMFPKQETEPSRAPFKPGAMENLIEGIEEFAEAAPKTTLKKRYGAFGADILKRDVRGRSQGDLLEKYTAWKTNIGYDGMTTVQQRQVDSQWDDWIGTQKGSWKWNPESKEVMAARSKGPLARSYGRQFYKTPIGPGEGGSQLQHSVAKSVKRPAVESEAKRLTEDIARSLMEEAGGDPQKARQLARERRYTE